MLTYKFKQDRNDKTCDSSSRTWANRRQSSDTPGSQPYNQKLTGLKAGSTPCNSLSSSALTMLTEPDSSLDLSNPNLSKMKRRSSSEGLVGPRKYDDKPCLLH